MKNRIILSRLVVIAVVAMALPLSAKAQDEGVQIRGLTRIDTTVRLDRGGAVDLSLISGRIRVTGWDRSDVKVTATIESGMLRFTSNSSRVSLSVDDSDDGGRRGHRHNNVGDARYDVSVPRGSRLILEAVSGDITSKGSQGEIEATSVSGDVDVTDGVRTVSAEAVSGSVHAAQVNGNLRTETVSGDLRAENVSGNVEASSVSGSIRLVGIQSKDVRTETVSGDIVYTGTIEPSGRYSFESHSGALRLNIPRGAGAQFSVETFSGDLQSDFPVMLRPQSSLGREGHIEFTIGDGRAKITAQTFSGSIIINNGSDSTTRRDDE
jgi:Putative adhesin